jgi:hypothetical protein
MKDLELANRALKLKNEEDTREFDLKMTELESKMIIACLTEVLLHGDRADARLRPECAAVAALSHMTWDDPEDPIGHRTD